MSENKPKPVTAFDIHLWLLRGEFPAGVNSQTERHLFPGLSQRLKKIEQDRESENDLIDRLAKDGIYDLPTDGGIRP